MDIQLYVYDLSKGLARTASAALLGIQIDAVYHTAIVFEGIEYLYDSGIKTVEPGSTHLGQPMEIINLGKTSLPMDVIMDYLDSLKDIYTAEAYDIWRHNCNNFSNDFATFLLGHGIPAHITNLPETVLNTPFGQMIAPQIQGAVEERKRKNGLLGIDKSNSKKKPLSTAQQVAAVKVPASLAELEKLLNEAKDSCAVVFFTSASCGPCRALYPTYDEMAAEAGNNCNFIKVDVSASFDIGTKYSISATPTFITFLHGEQENKWSGSDPSMLKGNVKMLIQMAWPPHQHLTLNIPTLRGSNTKAIIYGKVPPLDKLKAKMGSFGEDPSVKGVLRFVAARNADGAAEATLPDLDAFSWFLRAVPEKLPIEILFTVIDLLRIALADARFSGYYAEEKDHKTIAPLLTYINELKECPYSLRLVALQTACNLFSSPLYADHILTCPTLTTPIMGLITNSLLDDKHNNTRVAAASLAFNLAAANGRARVYEHKEALPQDDQIELAASLLEAISVEEESADAIKGYLLALGHLVFCCPLHGDMVELLRTMDAQGTVLQKKKLFPQEPLVREVGDELLGKGL
ncbi:DUF862-domain-containing protein [Coleophoma crateriformis]|uniref:DUF862-domain-containing protein n=1 Tax=Coleophoma crateriformis TaxID=565419 RepID=A0A3D8T806_9HELO|nr:DUF862-domain-containing protein [Coleophoma crateriformis]